jgi:DNA polymerase-3 subunit chi
MTEIWFYELQSQPLEKVLPNLIEKSLERGWRVTLQAKSEERIEALDSWLWIFSDESFLAHGRAADGEPNLQPIYLTTGVENPNGAALRLVVEGAEFAPALTAPGANYSRVVILFDGCDADERARAQVQWNEMKQQGFAAAYWQQDEKGRWGKRA